MSGERAPSGWHDRMAASLKEAAERYGLEEFEAAWVAVMCELSRQSERGDRRLWLRL
jgi:hypothetical protein